MADRPALGAALVVEGNALVAMEAQETLASCGYGPVDTVADASCGKALLVQGDYRLALIATGGAAGDCLDLAQAALVRGVPFAVMSDYADGRDIPRAIRSRPFLVRPFGKGELHAALDRLAGADTRQA